MPSISLVALSALLSLSPPPPADVAVDGSQRQVVVDALARALRTHYVFPDVGERSASALLEQLASGGHGQTRARSFADALTRSLQGLTKDKHLRVRFDPQFRGSSDPDAEPTAEQKARFRQMAAGHNFGVAKVEVLPGNVGLFDLRGFMPKELSAATLAAAMGVLSNTEALILDLRQNGGGDPETVAFLCTYFFPEGGRVHLNDIYNRPKNETTQFWTEVSVPGARYVGKPVYVLTSARTFSGAEEFAYNLQTQERGTLVGETTGGGAHPGGLVALGHGFVAFLPTGRAINPITRTNWEGVGVKPHVPTAATAALKTAHLSALRTLLQAEKDPARRQLLEQALAQVEKGTKPRPMYTRR